MSEEEDRATDVRITFRTHQTRVSKLDRIARAHDLKIGARYSIGAAINYVVDKHRDVKPKAAKKAAKGKKR